MKELKNMLTNNLMRSGYTREDAECQIEKSTIIIKAGIITVAYDDGTEDRYKVELKEYLVAIG